MASVIQPSFSSGEISPALFGRVDLAKYNVGLAKCRNAFVQSYGGVSKRSGTVFVGRTKNQVENPHCRLIPFQYSITQAYVLEVGAGYIRFFANGAQIVDGNNNPVEVATPYTSDDLRSIKYTQSADILFMVCGNYPPKMLKRLSADGTSWSFEDFPYFEGPFLDVDTSNNKVTPSATTGTITVTSVNNIFTANMVGSLMRIGEDVSAGTAIGTPNDSPLPELKVYKDWDLSTSGFWNGTFYLQRWSDEQSAWVTVRSYNSSFTEGATSSAGAKNYSDHGTVEEPTRFRIYANPGEWQGLKPDGGSDADKGKVTLTSTGGEFWGTVRITAFTNAKTVTATVEKEIPNTNATKLYAFGAWSNENGYPRAVTFYYQRLVFGCTKRQPQTLWFSKPDAYNDFSVSTPVADDDAVTVSLAANQVNSIRHLICMSDLQAFTSESEWKINSADKALTPSNIFAKSQTFYGASETEPVIIGNMIIYNQNKGNIVRNYGYDLNSDSFKGNDLTILASHLLVDEKIRSMALQKEPYGILWCVTDSYKLLGLTYLPEHDVVAWHKHDTDGEFHSTCCINGEETDDVYFVIRRSNGNYIERMSRRHTVNATLDNSIFLDCCKVFDFPTATSNLTGLEHLAGRVVDALADGFYIRNIEVANDGTVTLDTPAKHVVIGLPYTMEVETLPLNIDTGGETIQGKKKAVNKLTVRLLNSVGGKFSQGNGINDEIKYRGEPTRFSEPVGLKTGDFSLQLAGGYNNKGQVKITHDVPLPMTILAIIPDVTLGG